MPVAPITGASTASGSQRPSTSAASESVRALIGLPHHLRSPISADDELTLRPSLCGRGARPSGEASPATGKGQAETRNAGDSR